MKIKIRDITKEQIKKYCGNHQCSNNCELSPLCILKGSKYFENLLDIESAKKFLSSEYLDQEIEVEIEKSKPSKEVIAILKSIDKKWKWIAKYPDNDIELFTNKPEKITERNMWGYISGKCELITDLFNNNLFNFLSWEDEEPTNIEKLIKEYEDETTKI